MKPFDLENPGDPSDPLKRHDPLWNLLGNARPVEVSPLFARNVLREIRLADDRAPVGVVRGVLRWWRMGLIGATALGMVVMTGFVLLPEHERGSLVQGSVDAEAISDLDELLAYEPTNIWLDKSVY